MKVGGSFGFQSLNVKEFVEATGMTCAQVTFPMEHTNWRAEHQAIENWKALGVDLYVHAPLNINPCDETRRGWHLHSLAECCRFANEVGAAGVVLHPGSRKENPEWYARNMLVEFMRNVVGKKLYGGKFLLETDSGSKGGTKVGSPEFLQVVCEMVYSGQVRICIDTEHLYARGINLWDGSERLRILNGLGSHIELVHLNVPDEDVQLGKFLDRHSTAFIGRQDLGDSYTMIKDLVSRFPCILERHDLNIQEMDMKEIKKVMGTK